MKHEEEEDNNNNNNNKEEECKRKKRAQSRTLSIASISSSRAARLDSLHKLYLIKSNHKCSKTQETNKEGDAIEPTAALISNIIGSFGWFQLLVLIFSGLRDFADSYDALMMSMIFRPETNFYCADNQNQTMTKEHVYLNSTTSNEDHQYQCFRSFENGTFELDKSGNLVACQSWNFIRGSQGKYNDKGDDEEASLVIEWSLVCDRHWLVAPIQSAFFLGLVVGNLSWGYLADKFGRHPIYLVGHVIQVLFGLSSIFITNVSLYMMCRFFSAFGSASHNVLYSVQVEMIGIKYRPYCMALNHFGWGVGIISTPFIARAWTDYRYVIAVSPITTLIMLPLAFLLPESSRWLFMNGKPEQAQRELLRVAKFNGIPITPSLIDKIRQLNEQSRSTSNKQAIRDSAITTTTTTNERQMSTYRIILQDPILLRDTMILSYSIFLGYLFYYVLTLNFGYIENLSVEANFITSGAGEWLSVIVGAIMLKFLTRKVGLCLVLNIMSISFGFQFLIDSEIFPSLDTKLIITLNNAIGTASTLLLVYVLLIVNQEVFPTVVRQTGSSFVNTVAEIGATMAPIVIQVARVYGLWRADIISTLACLVGSVLVLFLTETGDKELT